MRETANRLLDPLAESGRLEFVDEYAIPFSLTAIGEILGADEEAFEVLRRGVETQVYVLNAILAGLPTEEELVAMGEELIAFTDFVSALVEERRKSPRDDYTSIMIHTARPDGSLASTAEITQAVIDLLGAGFKTTAGAMTLGIYTLLNNPDQWQLLLSDRALVPNAIEEMLRYRSLATRLFRRAVNDVVIGDVKVPAGALVALCLASAGRDEEIYERPDAFDIRRDRPQHLAFGKWQHFCVGAQLARLEMVVTLETLLERFPELHLAPDQDLEWAPDLRLDVLKELQLEA